MHIIIINIDVDGETIDKVGPKLLQVGIYWSHRDKHGQLLRIHQSYHMKSQ